MKKNCTLILIEVEKAYNKIDCAIIFKILKEIEIKGKFFKNEKS